MGVLRKGGREAIGKFRIGRLNSVRKLSVKSRPLSGERFGKTRSIIKSSVGLVNAALLAVLTKRYHMSCQKWVTQFVSGLPIVGELSQKYIYQTKNESLAAIWEP